ncbi:hypothetical protein L3Q82_026726, partial [Scortum barcoo]
MDALKSAGRAIIRSPSIAKQSWGSSRHKSDEIQVVEEETCPSSPSTLVSIYPESIVAWRKALLCSASELPENWTDTRETLLEGMAFQLKYLGVTMVEQPKGEELSAAAVKRIVSTAKASGKKLQKVTLTVSPRGIILYDSASNQLIENISIYRISYCTADKMHDKVFAYIVQSQHNETLECHAFLCPKRKMAQAVTLTVAQAFRVAFEFWQAAKEEKEKRVKSGSDREGASSSQSDSSASLGSLKGGEVATGKLLDLAEGANVALVHSGTKQTESDPLMVHNHATENNNTVWELEDGLDEAFSRLAESRTNPQVLDIGVNPQDFNTEECLSPGKWDQEDADFTAQKDTLGSGNYSNQEPVSSLIHGRNSLALRTKGRAGMRHPIPAELRRRPRGCKAGAKLKAELAENRRRYKPSIPSVIMGNVNSLPNKIDELSALNNQRIYRESSLFIFTETWLNHLVPDANVDLLGFTAVRADRDTKASGKSKGGGLIIADAATSCEKIHSVTARLQTQHPEAFMIISGDFNHATLDSTLAVFNQDRLPSPQLGKSDHNLVHLQPLYTPLVQKQPVTTHDQSGDGPLSTENSALRDCFNTTVWDVLMNPHGEDIEGMTHCLTDYLNFCADVVSPVKTVRCYPNNKPWVTREDKTVLNKKKAAFRSRDREAYESSTAGGETLCEGSQGQLQEKGGAEAEGKQHEGASSDPRCKHAQDRLQFAYQPGVGVEDAILYLLHRAHSHLDKGSGTVRILFLDFSSAFNTIQPTLLRDKLGRMGVDPQLMDWISDYLTGRPHTGAPQGTVLAPLLFTLYTSDFFYNSELCHIQKYADDTAIVGCIRDDREEEYRRLVGDFAAWCHTNHLQLNTSKTKELVIDFGRSRPRPRPVLLEGAEVEAVDSYRYLGLWLDNKLDWTTHTSHLYGKTQNRLYFLRRLRSFNICSKLLQMFYQSVVASVLFYTVVCWGGSISKKDTSRLDKLIRRAGSVVGMKLDSLVTVAESRTLDKLLDIMDNASHPLHTVISNQRSLFSERLLLPKCRTNRLKNSFMMLSCWTSSSQDLQRVLERFAAECEAAGMRISTSKSEAMVLDRKRVACPLRVGGEVLPQVEEFKYGKMMRDDRIGRRWSVRLTGGLVQRPQLCGRCIPDRRGEEGVKSEALDLPVNLRVPTLTYGHEIWSQPLLASHREESAEVAWASISDAPWDASLGRCSRRVPPGGGPGRRPRTHLLHSRLKTDTESVPAETMRAQLWWTFSCALVTLCSAQSPVCRATQDGNQTTYALSGLPPVAIEYCEYSWNSKGHVLANHKESDNKMVIENSINGLVTSRCLPEIDFMRSCTTEREPYAVNCTAQCHDALSQDDKEISHFWFGALAVVFLVSLIALALFFVSRSMFGDSRCGQQMWSAVARCGKKMNPPKPDVEAGTEIVTAQLQEVGVPHMVWPAKSHVWDQLKQILDDRTPPPRDLAELRVALVEEWNALPQNNIMRLVRSMRRRIQAVIAANGALVTLCSAQSPVCRATQDGNQTTYALSGLPPVAIEYCEYSWNSPSAMMLCLRMTKSNREQRCAERWAVKEMKVGSAGKVDMAHEVQDMDKKKLSTVLSRLNPTQYGHLKPLSIYSRMITCDIKDSLHQNFSNPFINFKIELVNNCAGKRKLDDGSCDDGYETPAKKTFSSLALSPDLGCVMDYCSPPGKRDSMSPFAVSKHAFLVETQASTSEHNGQSSTEPGGNEGTVPHRQTCETVLSNVSPAFDYDVDDILCLSPIGTHTAAGFSDHLQSCKSPGSNTSQNKAVLTPSVAHGQELEKGDGKGEEGGERPKKGMPLNLDVEEDKGYFSMSYINDLKIGKDPPPSQLHPASSSPVLRTAEDERPHPESPSEPGGRKRAALPAQHVSFTVGDFFVREPLSESVNSPVEPLEGDVEEVWDIGRPMFESSVCHSVTVKLNSSEHSRQVSEEVQVIEPVREHQATLCEEDASVDTSYETLPLQVQVKSVVVAPPQRTSSCKPAAPPLPDNITKSTKLSPKESRGSQSLKSVRSHRPVVFDRKRDWEREKRLYINSVTRHINEKQRGVQDAMSELLELMTHVADQTSGTEWQHPSDLTRRYLILIGYLYSSEEA